MTKDTNQGGYAIVEKHENGKNETPSIWSRILHIAVSEALATLLPAMLFALVINVFVAEAAIVEEGPSMQPNLYRGYQVMTEKVSYRFHAPRRGDVVIVEQPDHQVSLIKRVVGLPGERIEVRGGHTFINGQRLEEPWVTHFGGPDSPSTQIPHNHVFILGDNRANSRDSRAIGPVPVSSIRGRVWLIYWPLDQCRLMLK